VQKLCKREIIAPMSLALVEHLQEVRKKRADARGQGPENPNPI
jgi:hypothetical protein